LAEIRLKRSNERCFISATDLGRTHAKKFPNWQNFAQIGAQKTNHGLNFGQLGRYPTKIGGGNQTARIRPFLNEFRPKKITV
jgi:hypothetical protein